MASPKARCHGRLPSCAEPVTALTDGPKPRWSRGDAMPVFELGDVALNYRDVGAGVPFVFQHGLGGDIRQPVLVYSPPHGVRLLSFDARAHGETVSSGDPAELKFDAFGDDLIG